MKVRLLALAVFAFLSPLSALAADTPAAKRDLANGCAVYTLCDAEADVGVCKNAAGTLNIVADVGGRYTATAYATSSTATTYTCDLYTSDNGYQATTRTPITSSGTSTNLSAADSRYSVSFSATFASLWAECTTAITGGVVTINAYICPLGR